MDELTTIKQEIEDLKNRNKRVEANKAWETSTFRTILITLVTYVIATFVLYFIEVEQPYFGALVPTIGFFLSIQSLPQVKKWWINKFLD